MKRPTDQDGFSLVELLVAIVAFSGVAFAFMSVMMSTARSTDTARDHVRISEEARLGLNRMVRDTREAGWVALPDTNPNTAKTSFTVQIDYNGDGSYANPPGPDAPAEGNFEVVTYAYDDANDRITLSAAGFGTETLVKGVDCVRDVSNNCKSDVFSFTSNRLEYDWSSPTDGVTTLGELNQAACSPNNITTMDVCNGVLVNGELANVTNVNMAFSVSVGGRKTDFYAEAQLRNRR